MGFDVPKERLVSSMAILDVELLVLRGSENLFQRVVRDETKRLGLLRRPFTAKNLLRHARVKEDLTLGSDH
jgi:hypothetical protein